jgi:transposase
MRRVPRRRRRACPEMSAARPSHRQPRDAEQSDDLVGRQFDPIEPDRLWVMDVTEHPTGEGKVHLAVVLDAFSRRVVGWSIADHIRSELVVDAVQMAIWRRQPVEGHVIAHSPRPHPPEFRQRAVELARLREKPVAVIAKDLGISDSCLRGWMARADVDEGRRDGVSSRDREELIELRRELRVAKLENEILKRAAAFFARENVLPK